MEKLITDKLDKIKELVNLDEMGAKGSPRNVNRVFVLGAGVSASCGYPLIKDLLKDVLKNHNQECEEDTHKLFKILELLYPTFSEKYQNFPNIEEFLSLLDTMYSLSIESMTYLSSVITVGYYFSLFGNARGKERWEESF